jgi:SAM-dependent methyltransferase
MSTRIARQKGLALPPRGAFGDPGPDDPLEFYYRPHTAWLYRARLRLGLRLLGDGPFESLLEAGYGSGILYPELSRRAKRLAGIDVHDYRASVERALGGLGIEADLRDGSVLEIPFEAGEFDALVCLSVLEHITELDVAFDEFARVLRPGGVAVVGFPARNPVTDRLFRMLGYDPREIHPSSHTDIVAAARRSALDVEESAKIPPVAPDALSAYLAVRVRARA